MAGHEPRRDPRKSSTDARGVEHPAGRDRSQTGRAGAVRREGGGRKAGKAARGGGSVRSSREERVRRSDARTGTREDGSRAAGRSVEGARRYPPVHLSDEVVKELNETARPGKGPILVEVFARAAAAFAAGDFAEAIELGNQAKHIALRSPSVREFLGLALYRAERWKEAAGELSTFRRLAGSQEQ